MSISNSTKIEIIKKNIFKLQQKSILQGIFVACGNLIISNGEIKFNLSSELEDVIKFSSTILSKLFPSLEFDISKVVRSFKNKERFELSSNNNSEQVLKELGVINYDKNKMLKINELCDKLFLKTEQDMKAFLCGLFLGSGSVSVPYETKNKSAHGYHFEIDLQTKNQADMVAEIFSNFDIFPKLIERGEVFVVYLKNSDTICDVLSIFGASKTMLDLMNKKVDRDMNNLMNRQVNCISANLDKTVNASIKQMNAIEIIQNTIGVENLPDTLCEAALLRLSNPEASLSDLISLMEKKISKGALAQRFDKIIKISMELGENNE